MSFLWFFIGVYNVLGLEIVLVLNVMEYVVAGLELECVLFPLLATVLIICDMLELFSGDQIGNLYKSLSTND